MLYKCYITQAIIEANICISELWIAAQSCLAKTALLKSRQLFTEFSKWSKCTNADYLSSGALGLYFSNTRTLTSCLRAFAAADKLLIISTIIGLKLDLMSSDQLEYCEKSNKNSISHDQQTRWRWFKSCKNHSIMLENSDCTKPIRHFQLHMTIAYAAYSTKAVCCAYTCIKRYFLPVYLHPAVPVSKGSQAGVEAA